MLTGIPLKKVVTGVPAMGALNRITQKEADERDSGFQIMWMLLHLTGVAMHLGSAAYHMRRIRREKNESVQD